MDFVKNEELDNIFCENSCIQNFILKDKEIFVINKNKKIIIEFNIKFHKTRFYLEGVLISDEKVFSSIPALYLPINDEIIMHIYQFANSFSLEERGDEYSNNNVDMDHMFNSLMEKMLNKFVLEILKKGGVCNFIYSKILKNIGNFSVIYFKNKDIVGIGDKLSFQIEETMYKQFVCRFDGSSTSYCFIDDSSLIDEAMLKIDDVFLKITKNSIAILEKNEVDEEMTNLLEEILEVKYDECSLELIYKKAIKLNRLKKRKNLLSSYCLSLNKEIDFNKIKNSTNIVDFI